MVVIGFWVAVVTARFDTSFLHRRNRDASLIVPLFDIFVFAIFLGLAILWRRVQNATADSCLSYLGSHWSCVWQDTGNAHSVAFYGGIDGLLLLGVLRDLAVSPRIHQVYMIALPFLVAEQTAVSEVFLR